MSCLDTVYRAPSAASITIASSHKKLLKFTVKMRVVTADVDPMSKIGAEVNPVELAAAVQVYLFHLEILFQIIRDSI